MSSEKSAPGFSEQGSRQNQGFCQANRNFYLLVNQISAKSMPYSLYFIIAVLVFHILGFLLRASDIFRKNVGKSFAIMRTVPERAWLMSKSGFPE